MANYSASKVVSKTLSGSTVDQVTITGGWPSIEVVNRSTTAVLWAVAGSPGNIPADPAAAGDNIEPILPGERIVMTFGQAVPGQSQYVKLIGTGNDYSVVGTIAK